MNKFRLKSKKTGKEIMIHILNDVLKEYDVIVDGHECFLTMSGDGALTIEVIREKLNHRYEKIMNKNGEEQDKEKASWANNKKLKERFHKSDG